MTAATTSQPTTGTRWLLHGQLSEDEPVRHVRVELSPFVVGRRVESSLCITSPTVSGKHAEIVIVEDALLVRDLGSTNGTYVNGVRVTEACRVRHGDLIQFAQIVFRACLEKDDRNTKTVAGDAGDRALALIQFD